MANTILFASMVATLLIALHQSMTNGFANSYWLFMLTFILMIFYQMRANKAKEMGTPNTDGKSEQSLKKRKGKGNS